MNRSMMVKYTLALLVLLMLCDWANTEQLTPMTGAEARNVDSTMYYPVKLVCPKTNDGLLEYTTKQVGGKIGKLVVVFASGKATGVTLDLQSPETAEPTRVVDSSVSAEDDEKLYKLRRQGNTLYQEVCLAGLEQRNKYQSMLATNRSILSLSAK